MVVQKQATNWMWEGACNRVRGADRRHVRTLARALVLSPERCGCVSSPPNPCNTLPTAIHRSCARDCTAPSARTRQSARTFVVMALRPLATLALVALLSAPAQARSNCIAGRFGGALRACVRASHGRRANAAFATRRVEGFTPHTHARTCISCATRIPQPTHSLPPPPPATHTYKTHTRRRAW